MVESSWVVQVTEALDNTSQESCLQERFWKKRSIYKLPACVTDLNDNAYRPQAVSFGPYHHGAPNLNPMEEHKWRALRHFLNRAPKKTSGHFVKAVSEVVQDLKDCYRTLDPKWHEDSNESFVKLMILDGCFMLEILRTGSQTINDYETIDPIFSNHGRLNIMPYIQRDMLMLENQLPMLVLDILVSVESEQPKEKDHVKNLILKFFSQSEVQVIDECLHVLDVYRKCMTHKLEPSKKTKSSRGAMAGDNKDAIIRSATELDEAGIEFKVSDTNSLRDVSFTKGGVLRLPIIIVDDTTESMFLNLIAFERLHVDAGNAVASYIFIMDSIIDNEHDVALLHSKGIIQSAIGSDKAVAKLFNSLSRDVALDEESDLMVVHRRVNKYCKKPWKAWRANLIHTYFRSPWAILSLIAAVFLFALTIVQTIYTVFPTNNN